MRDIKIPAVRINKNYTNDVAVVGRTPQGTIKIAPPVKPVTATLIDPVTDKDDFYQAINEMLKAGVMNTASAGRMITAEIMHRVVTKVHENPMYLCDNKELLEDNIFNDLKGMIIIHLDNFIRNQIAGTIPDKYFTIYTAMEFIVERANEYYDFGIKYDDVKNELESFYNVFM